MGSDEIVESAKAVQEVAKAAGSAIQAGRDAGGFIAKYVAGPLAQVSRMIEDQLKYSADVRFVRLVVKFQAELQALGPDVNLKALPLNFALPILEEAVMEEDDDLQDLWARLLANTADADSGVVPRRAHISMIRDMSPFDALVFEAIYTMPREIAGQKPVVTHELPGRAYAATEGTKMDAIPDPSEEIILSLSNLERMGAIAYGASWGGAEIFKVVNETVAGRELMKAIKRRAA